MMFLFLLCAVVFVLPLRALGTIQRKQVELGETVVLKCNISLHNEIFWLRVNMEDKPRLLMVARLKNDGGLTEILNYDDTRFEGCVEDKFFGLRIFSILKSDLGSYYCGTAEGKRMEFEEGVHMYKKDEVSPVDEKRFNFYPVFAAVLGIGQLAMVLAIFTVHMVTWKKRNKTCI